MTIENDAPLTSEQQLQFNKALLQLANNNPKQNNFNFYDYFTQKNLEWPQELIFDENNTQNNQIALAILVEILNQNPNANICRTFVGVCQANLGNTDAAYAEFTKMFDFQSENKWPMIIAAKTLPNRAAELYFERATKNNYTQNFARLQRETDYRKVLEYVPDHLGAAFELIKYNIHEWKYEKAIEILIPCIESYPNNFEVQFYYAKSLTGAKQFEKAAEVYKKCLEIDPENPNAIEMQALNLLQTGLYEQAVLVVQNASISKPATSMQLAVLGAALSNLNRNNEAIDAFEKSIELDNKNMLAYYHRANLLEKMGKHEEAANDLSNAKKIALAQMIDKVITEG